MCRHRQLVTDWSSGDKICTKCGVIMEESLMQEEIAEYRDFDGSHANSTKQRTSAPESIYVTNPREDFARDNDEKLFYDTGLSMMNEFFASEFQDSRPENIQRRSQELFDHAFRCQKEQKLGLRPFGHHDLHDEQSDDSFPVKRQKYSQKKTCIIASIRIACHEYNNYHFKLSLQSLCRYFQKNVPESKVKQVFDMWRHNDTNTSLQKTQALLTKNQHCRKTRRRHFDRQTAFSVM